MILHPILSVLLPESQPERAVERAAQFAQEALTASDLGAARYFHALARECWARANQGHTTLFP
jgi:hypothetical protein